MTKYQSNWNDTPGRESLVERKGRYAPVFGYDLRLTDRQTDRRGQIRRV